MGVEAKQSPFEELSTAVHNGGVSELFDRLIDTLKTDGKLPQLFEAMLMKTRYELGLPIHSNESLRDLPEHLQEKVENRYIEICRTVGSLFLERGDIVGSWPYFRAIDEPGAVAQALEQWEPPDEEAEITEDPQAADSDAVIDIAFNQGANPRRGYELILSQYGTCRAITFFEHQFPFAGEVKKECAAMLVRRLYGELLDSLRSDIERQEKTGEGTTGKEKGEKDDVRSLIQDRPWLFEGHGYHVDMSHLQAVVRAASILTSAKEIDLAVQMCEYGRQLSRELQQGDRPPFDDFYNDYRIFLRALNGEGIDGAVRYFSNKADRVGPDEEGNHYCGEVVVYLFYRLGRYQDAIQAYLKYLRTAPGPLSFAPSLYEICDLAGDYDALMELSREKQDLLQYAAALARKNLREQEAEEPRD